MVHRVPDCGFAAAYVVEEEQGLLAVDVGSVGASEQTQKLITDGLGRKIEEIRFIVATHFHIDHISGIGHLLKKCPPSTKVIAGYMVRDYLEGRRSICPMRNWVEGLLPAAVAGSKQVHKPQDLPVGLSGIPVFPFDRLAIPGFDPDRMIYAGSGRPLCGFGQWEIIETPGHTEDSISLYNAASAELICGDLILNLEKNGRGKLNRFHWDPAVIMNTFLTLKKEITAARIYPGHGEVISSHGNALLDVESI
jgi:glyoxylase-like metal-dependent hydrolase (beta-lactamase superfamily II)